jgi:hypothetical protein
MRVDAEKEMSLNRVAFEERVLLAVRLWRH